MGSLFDGVIDIASREVLQLIEVGPRSRRNHLVEIPSE